MVDIPNHALQQCKARINPVITRDVIQRWLTGCPILPGCKYKYLRDGFVWVLRGNMRFAVLLTAYCQKAKRRVSH